LDTGIVFWIRHYWEIRKVVSTDCVAPLIVIIIIIIRKFITRTCSQALSVNLRRGAGHALAGIATMTSLRHWPTTGNHDRHALVEVCTVIESMLVNS